MTGLEYAIQVEEDDDDMDLSSWSNVISGRGRGRIRRIHKSLLTTKVNKINLEENSWDEGTDVVWEATLREEVKVILKFKEEYENIQIWPITLSRELKK